MTLFLIYLAGTCQALQITLVLVSVALVVVGLTMLLFGVVEESPACIETVKRRFWWPILTCVIASLLPSKDLLYVAAGLNAAHEVSQTELGRKAYQIINRKLDEMLQDEQRGPTQ